MNPVLYATRQQPHCLRARMALAYARIPYEWKEAACERSAEGTAPPGGETGVPLLQFDSGDRLATSMEILHWAVLKNDPDGWLDFEVDLLDAMNDLVRINDVSFAADLSRYQGAASARQRDLRRAECELFVQGLERRLARAAFLFGERVSFADAAIFPFVQAFAQVQPRWFAATPYGPLRDWSERMLVATPYRSVLTAAGVN